MVVRNSILVIFVSILSLAISFGTTALALKGFFWIIGWSFSWKVAFWIWLGFFLENCFWNLINRFKNK